MAGASMNDIKARMKSVRSTMQITKAMELVATSKLRRAKERVEKSRFFYAVLGDAIRAIRNTREAEDSVWSVRREDAKTLYVVMAGDRGLAGGYNANIFRLTEKLAQGKNAVYLPIGKKAIEYYRQRGAEMDTDSYDFIADMHVGDALALAERICERFRSGEIGAVVLVYTEFVSMITQTPVHRELLPFPENGDKKNVAAPCFEGDVETILDHIVPDYVGGVLYSAVCESLASESGARRSAMNAANKNAGEMIDSLMLSYNRARQSVITQEITEIVSGAEAL
ncbi:MAG: ATP synthase F1 subunit gamma [Clostridia bacterium]|nr:ATP synthase F1 subunit gamma [Clostridia bacterium]